MPRPPGINGGDDGEKPVASIRIRKHMATTAKSLIVVIAVAVRMPQIDNSATDRPAGARQDATGNFDRRSLEAWLAQIETLRRARLEERTFGLAQCRLVTIAAFAASVRVAAR